MKAKLDESMKLRGKGTANPTEVGENKSTEILSDKPNINKALEDGFISEDEMQSLFSTDAITTKTNEVQTKLDKYNELNTKYEAIDQETKDEYKGRLSDTAIAALVSDRQKAIYRSLQNARNEYESAFGSLTSLKSDQAQAIEMNLGIYKDNQAFERQKQLADYQASLALSTDQAKFEQQMAQQAQVANDPVMATQAVIDQYRKLGVFAERSDADIIQSIQNDITSGMTLGESLTNLNKAFQSKEAYKTLVTPKPTTAGQVWTKLNDTTLVNQATGETKTV